MTHQTPYIVTQDADLARVLQRSGYWDHALAVLPAEATVLRAQILTDRFWWRLDDPADAEAAVAALFPQEHILARFYDAQIAYTRVLFEAGPRPGDTDRARDGFAAAADDARLAGWGAFWSGVLADNVGHAPDRAVAAYTQALTWARRHEDWMLESYAVRHLGDHALQDGDSSGLNLLRRSYHLRATLGARPQTAAAAATLATALPKGNEAGQLKEAASLTARELHLTWLLQALPERL